MDLYDDLFSMRRQFYEESKRRWEEEKQESSAKICCPQCGSSDLARKEGNLWCKSCGLSPIFNNSNPKLET